MRAIGADAWQRQRQQWQWQNGGICANRCRKIERMEVSRHDTSVWGGTGNRMRPRQRRSAKTAVVLLNAEIAWVHDKQEGGTGGGKAVRAEDNVVAENEHAYTFTCALPIVESVNEVGRYRSGHWTDARGHESSDPLHLSCPALHCTRTRV